jgi:DNA-binding beta-propeller fold protein YncE
LLASTGAVENNFTNTEAGTTFVGSDGGEVFDGVNLWVSSFCCGGLSQLQVSTATVVNTYNMPYTLTPGPGPVTLAYDGMHVWVTNPNGNSVFMVQPIPLPGINGPPGPPNEYEFGVGLTGNVIGTIPVGNDPAAITFDGANIWVANEGDNTVTKIPVF